VNFAGNNATSEDGVIVTSLDEVMTSQNDVDDVPGVDDDDAKTLDDGSDYIALDDDKDNDEFHYKYRTSPEYRSSYYSEPHHYTELEHHEPQYYYQPKESKSKKKVYVPVFVPEKQKKKSKLGTSVDHALTLLDGRQKGIRPVKKLEWWDADMVICLGRGADLHMAQLMLLHLTISCCSKSRLVLTSSFYLSGTGSPG